MQPGISGGWSQMVKTVTESSRLESRYSDAIPQADQTRSPVADCAGAPRGEAATSWERWLAGRLLAAIGNPPIQLVLPGGTVVPTGSGQAQPRVWIRDRRTLWKLATNPLFQFGEAYSNAAAEVQGELCDLLAGVYHSLARSALVHGPRAGLSRWFCRLMGSTLAAARRNIHHHYDIGNDFYRLWLDEQMVYTCAYFAEESYSLEEAQTAKMDHICRKVRLAEGETVVEAGCGWGAMALHMARQYGVQVRAYNISREQIEHARQRASREGLEDRVQFIQDDWRRIQGQYDVFLSVGMLEHIGLRNYGRFGGVIDRCLKPGGRGLIHSIGRNQPARVNSWIERRIFPGTYVPTLDETAARCAAPRFFDPGRGEPAVALRSHAAPLAGALRALGG